MAHFRSPTRWISGRWREALPIAPLPMPCLRANRPWTLEPVPLNGLRLGIPQGLPLRDLDPTVQAGFSAATAALSQPARAFGRNHADFGRAARVQAKASFSSVESYAIHRRLLASHAADYDPMVRGRIEAGRDVSAADYIEMLRQRADLVRAMDERLGGLDALVMPTVPIVAPEIAEVAKADTAREKICCCCATQRWRIFSICARSQFRFRAKAACPWA